MSARQWTHINKQEGSVKTMRNILPLPLFKANISLHPLDLMDRERCLRQASRLCVLVYRYRCLHGTAPSYLADDLQLTSAVGTCRQLRSADSPTLVVRSTRRSTLGDRAFPVAAACAWNSLPPAVRDAPSLLTFRSCLKT